MLRPCAEENGRLPSGVPYIAHVHIWVEGWVVVAAYITDGSKHRRKPHRMRRKTPL